MLDGQQAAYNTSRLHAIPASLHLLQEAALVLLQVSTALSSTANSKPKQQGKSHATVSPQDRPAMHGLVSSASEAMSGCIERVCSSAVGGNVGPASAVALLQDLAVLMQLGRSAVVLALNDVQRMVSASIDGLKAIAMNKAAMSTNETQQAGSAGMLMAEQIRQQRENKRMKQSKAQQTQVLHKLVFMLAWANELSDTVYDNLFNTVMLEMQEHSSILQSQESTNLFSLQPETYVKSMLKFDQSKMPELHNTNIVTQVAKP